MTDTEMVMNARRLADKLQITPAMLSVYVKAYSQLTKTQISKVGRLGRHFTSLQVEVITNAREMVANNTGVTVEEAMRKALVFDSAALEAPAMSLGASDEAEAILRALRAEVTAPIVEELQALRRDMAELQAKQLDKDNLGENLEATPGSTAAQVDPKSKHGLLVKFALWVERVLKS